MEYEINNLLNILTIDMMFHHLQISRGFQPQYLWKWVDHSKVYSREYLETVRDKIADSWIKFKCTGHGAIELGEITIPSLLNNYNFGLESRRSGNIVFLKMNYDEYSALIQYLQKKVNIVKTIDTLELRFKNKIQERTGIYFIKKRPSWLVNPITGELLELDMYNERFKIAIEYNGPQHYTFPNNYHKNKIQFNYQLQKDKIKKQICIKNGIKFISIRSNNSLDNEIKQFFVQF